MRDEDLIYLYKAAIAKCKKSRFKDEAEEFGSWIIIKYLENKRQHQPLELSLIDYIRETYGNKRSASWENRFKFFDYNDQRDSSYINPRNDTLRTLHFETPEFLASFDKELTSQEKEIFSYYYEEDLKMREIATIFSLSESRVSQILTGITKKLRTILGVTDARLDASDSGENKG